MTRETWCLISLICVSSLSASEIVGFLDETLAVVGVDCLLTTMYNNKCMFQQAERITEHIFVSDHCHITTETLYPAGHVITALNIC